MASHVTALAWRPQTFKELVGQDVITQTLTNAIGSDRLHHAYLFSGLRGSGKTSTARIFAKALNCHKGPTADPCLECPSCTEIKQGNALDVVEIDAASNNSVDNIRELREWVRYSSARDRYKIFIIDEVHMLSGAAFNALLKTLEEPPPNVIFIMATTELHKIPATILSRTQQFDFRQIPLFKIEEHLNKIAEAEKLNIDKDAFPLIARASGGSLRDALSIFDQVLAASDEHITRLDVQSILGVVEDATLLDLLESVIQGSAPKMFNRVSELVHYGHELRLVYDAFCGLIRDSIVCKSKADPSEMGSRQYGHGDKHESLIAELSQTDLVRMLDVMVQNEFMFRSASIPRYAFELVLLKLMELQKLIPMEELLSKLSETGLQSEEKKNLS